MTLTEQGRLEEAYERALRARSADARGRGAAASAAAYTLTYAGFLDDAVRSVEDVLAADSDYVKTNGWWTPTALLYLREASTSFCTRCEGSTRPSARLYRALAEAERGRRANAVPHLAGIESSATDVFNGLALALHAGLTGHGRDGAAMIRAIADQRRAAHNNDGEITFKQAQILSVAGEPTSALATLDEAVAQGFVCVTCFESSSLLEPVRALPDYQRVKQRAAARQLAFGRRFGLQTPPLPH